MPDQFGNPTTQEVLAQITAEKDEIMMQASSPDERRMANLYAIGRMMSSGQDPRMLRAKGIEDAQREVQAMPRDDEESELSYTRRLTSALADRLRGVDPAAAALARNEAKKLESEEQNRRILQQQEHLQRLSIAEAEDEQSERARLEDKGYVIDMATGDFLGQVDTKAPDYAERVETIRKGRPTVTDVSYDDMLKFANDAALTSVGKQVSVQQFGKLAENLDQNFAMGVTVNQLYDIAEEAWKSGQNPMSSITGMTNKIQTISNGIGELHRVMRGTNEPLEDYLDGDRGQEFLQRAVRAGISKSLFQSLAYMFAMARNDRVTDADLEAALDMIGANGGDIRVAMSAIDQQLRNQRVLMTSADTSIGLPPDQGGVWSPGQYGILTSKRDAARGQLDRAITRGETARARTFDQNELTGPPGTPPAPSADATRRVFE